MSIKKIGLLAAFICTISGAQVIVIAEKEKRYKQWEDAQIAVRKAWKAYEEALNNETLDGDDTRRIREAQMAVHKAAVAAAKAKKALESGMD
jgi:hypothetical protein